MAALDYTEIYDPDTDVDALYTRATGERIASRLRRDDRVLELGCATGLMTKRFSAAGADVVGVDRSLPYLERARARRLRGTRFVEGDLEQLGALSLGQFEHVVLCSVLHEVADPQALLRRVAREHLAPGGLVHVSLQNPHSLHRLVALEMGLLESIDELSERGERFGSTRLWTADELGELCASAGLAERAREGVVLKPLPNALMAELPDDVVLGLSRAARHLPRHGAMNLLTLERA